MRKLGEILRWSRCSSILAVALSVPTSRAADRRPPSGLSVRVVNTPLPVSGPVNVGNLPASQSISGSVTITNTPNVTVANTPLVVTGSVTHGTNVIADIETDGLGSQPAQVRARRHQSVLENQASRDGQWFWQRHRRHRDGWAWRFLQVDAGNVESRLGS